MGRGCQGSGRKEKDFSTSSLPITELSRLLLKCVVGSSFSHRGDEIFSSRKELDLTTLEYLTEQKTKKKKTVSFFFSVKKLTLLIIVSLYTGFIGENVKFVPNRD